MEKAKKYEHYSELLTKLRDFYLAIADASEPRKAGTTSTDPQVVRTVDAEVLTDHLPIGWISVLHGPYPTDFHT